MVIFGKNGHFWIEMAIWAELVNFAKIIILVELIILNSQKSGFYLCTSLIVQICSQTV